MSEVKCNLCTAQLSSSVLSPLFSLRSLFWHTENGYIRVISLVNIAGPAARRAAVAHPLPGIFVSFVKQTRGPIIYAPHYIAHFLVR